MFKKLLTFRQKRDPLEGADMTNVVQLPKEKKDNKTEYSNMEIAYMAYQEVLLDRKQNGLPESIYSEGFLEHAQMVIDRIKQEQSNRVKNLFQHF